MEQLGADKKSLYAVLNALQSIGEAAPSRTVRALAAEVRAELGEGAEAEEEQQTCAGGEVSWRLPMGEPVKIADLGGIGSGSGRR